jgi:hypothetical protein
MSWRSTSGCREHPPNVRRPTGRREVVSPAPDNNQGSLRVDLLLRGTNKISKHLPLDRRVPLQKPCHDGRAILVGTGCQVAVPNVHALMVPSR